MPQKPLHKPNKKIEKKKVANNHGRGSKTKIGKMERPPKKGKVLEAYKDDKELTKAINKRNESTIAGLAQNAGGRLQVLKPPPPILATKDQQQQAKKAKQAEADKKVKEAAVGSGSGSDDEMDDSDDDE